MLAAWCEKWVTVKMTYFCQTHSEGNSGSAVTRQRGLCPVPAPSSTHTQVLLSTVKGETHTVVKARARALNHLCPTVTLCHFLLVFLRTSLLLSEHFVSHVHNFSESTVRKRIFITKRIIFLSKRKIWCFGFFFFPP